MKELLMLLLIGIAPGDSANPDQTERVIDLIADFQINHDEVFKEGFAFIGKGLEVYEKGSEAHVTDKWFLCVYEGRNRRLDASGRAGSNNLGKHIESWMQYLQYDGRQLFRPSFRHSETIDTSTDAWREEEKRTNPRQHLAVPQPMRYLLKSSFGYSAWTDPNSRCGSVYLLSDDAELVEGKYTKEGDIAADFRLEANIPLVFTVTFGKKEKFLPISTLSKIQLGGRWIPSKYTEVSWDHRDKFSLPEKVKVTQFPLSQRSPKIFLEVDFNWLIGPEVTEKIDPDLSDWRKPFRTLFDVDWQLAGGRKPAAN